jgi:hypothetical protein
MAAFTLPAYPCRLVTDKDAPLGDPSAEWWTLDDIAAYLGVKPATARRYRMPDRGKGSLPAEDRMFGRTPAWKPATIIAWNEQERLGQGARTDLHRPPAS